MRTWTLEMNCEKDVYSAFRSIETTFKLKGIQITRGRLNQLICHEIGNKRYYIKRYTRPGKGLRQVMGRSHLRGEWENLLRFKQWGLPTVQLIAFGLEKYGPFFKRGAIITVEAPNTKDLAQLAKENDVRLSNRQWVTTVSSQLAQAARIMHRHRFAHGDFKWRNILVTEGPIPQVYLIDCPLGGFWCHPFLQHRKNKDLACLDKVGKKVLTRTQRLRFFLNYLEKKRLSAEDKRQLRHVLRFFEKSMIFKR